MPPGRRILGATLWTRRRWRAETTRSGRRVGVGQVAIRRGIWRAALIHRRDRYMQIRRRYAVVLAVAAAVAVAGTGLAIANTASNGNVSGGVFGFKPKQVPKKKFRKGALTLGTKTTFANQPNQ